MAQLGVRIVAALTAAVVALPAGTPALASAPEQPPGVVARTLADAQAMLRAWCPTVTIQLLPAGAPPTADPENVVVTTEAYVAPPTEQKACTPGVPQVVRLGIAVTVPTLDGLTVGQARDTVARHGLAFVAPDGAPLEAVVKSQRPIAGAQIAVGAVPFPTTPVTVAVAVKVPDVTREVEGEACAELQRAGLACSLVAGGNAPPPGLVLGQDPVAGALVEPSSTVTLQVLRLESRTPVPNVVGLAEEAACAPVEAVKLVCDLRLTVPGDPPGKVVGQAPPADTTVPSGSRVSVQVQRVPQQVTVPDLVGSTEDAVCQQLYDVKLACAPSIEGAGVMPGRVVSQRPAADSLVPADAVVSVRIRREQGIPVPDVIGRSSEEALRTLGQARLACLFNGGEGRVLSQDPPAGTLVAAGTSVNVLLAGAAPGLPWWLFAVVVAVVAALAAVVARQTYRRRRERRHRGPRVAVELHTGPARVRADEAREW